MTFNIVKHYELMMAEAVLRQIDEDMARSNPEAYPELYAELVRRDSERDAKRRQHRETCNCEYCGFDEF